MARIDIEHFAIRLQRLVDLAVFLKGSAFDKGSECPSFTLALRTKKQIRSRLQVERIVLLITFFYDGGRRTDLGQRCTGGSRDCGVAETQENE